MKKTIFFIGLILVVNSCNSERDFTAEELKNENSQSISKIAPDDSKCIAATAPTTFYGNPNDYPKILTSTYYSINSLPDPYDDLWFFNQLARGTTAYVSEHYYRRRAAFPWSTTEAYFQDFPYDVEQAFTIYSSEQGLNGEINTYNHNISPAAGSYLQYRILSSIDEFVILAAQNFGNNLLPKGITYSTSTTPCGGYLGLQVRVFYKKVN